jgi:hypothetical protein
MRRGVLDHRWEVFRLQVLNGEAARAGLCRPFPAIHAACDSTQSTEVHGAAVLLDLESEAVPVAFPAGRRFAPSFHEDGVQHPQPARHGSRPSIATAMRSFCRLDSTGTKDTLTARVKRASDPGKGRPKKRAA